MFGLTEGMSYYVCQRYVNMGLGINGLYKLVSQEMGEPPLGGGVFIFFGKSRQSVKILRWDTDGFVLYHKRLERGKMVPQTCMFPTCEKEVPRLWRRLRLQGDSQADKLHLPSGPQAQYRTERVDRGETQEMEKGQYISDVINKAAALPLNTPLEKYRILLPDKWKENR